MQEYAVIAVLIQFAFHLEQIPDFAIGKSLNTQAFNMLYGWCDTKGCNSLTNPSPHIDFRI